MDIEFIEQEHRDNIFKIMELCNCDMAQAYELYNNNACNVENAVQAKFSSFENPVPVAQNYPQPSYSSSSYGVNNNFGFGNNPMKRGISEDDEYQNYKNFKETGNTFNKRYEVRRDNSGLARGVLSFFKSPQNTFKKNLESYIGKRINLNLQNGSLSEALESVTKQKFPLIAHVLDFKKDSNIINNVTRVYTDEYLVQMMNEQFKNHGLSTKQYELQSFLKKFINSNSDANHLLIFRINAVEEVVLMTKINLLSTSVDEIKKKFKQIKSNCINIEMEEMHLQKRYQQQLKGNFNYQKPMSLAEKRKLQQDRQIRRKQQQEFFAAMQPKKEEIKPSSNQYTTSTKPQVSPVKKDLKAEAKQQRQKIRNNLKIYETDGEGMIAIKLRLPSSELKKLYVHSSEPAQYLYDYVFSREQDLGFQEDETKRVFDIIEPYEKLNLSQRKKEPLGKVFDGETMLTLVVNEKSE